MKIVHRGLNAHISLAHTALDHIECLVESSGAHASVLQVRAGNRSLTSCRLGPTCATEHIESRVRAAVRAIAARGGEGSRIANHHCAGAGRGYCGAIARQLALYYSCTVDLYLT